MAFVVWCVVLPTMIIRIIIVFVFLTIGGADCMVSRAVLLLFLTRPPLFSNRSRYGIVTLFWLTNSSVLARMWDA